jgi:hypothetical protein
MKKVLLLLILLLLDTTAAMEVAESPGSISGAMSTPLWNAPPAETKNTPYTGPSAYEIMYNAALQSPGVGQAVVVVDMAHIGVTIAPNQYAISQDLADAVGNLIVAYAGLVQAVPEYNGYLRVGISNVGPDGKNHIVQLFEASAYSARDQTTNTIGNYVNQVLANGKSLSYEYLVDGYPVKWPGYDPSHSARWR